MMMKVCVICLLKIRVMVLGWPLKNPYNDDKRFVYYTGQSSGWMCNVIVLIFENQDLK